MSRHWRFLICVQQTFVASSQKIRITIMMRITMSTETKMNKQNILAGKVTRAMNFNEKVWALTTQIPRGRVATYGEIARRLQSKGYRAVGNALNRNPLAPAVPCHRVVGSDGSLTGFAGGLAKKRQMLISEGVSLTNGKVASAVFYRFD